MLNINIKKLIKPFLIITTFFPESGSEDVEILGSIIRLSSASSRAIAPITHFLRTLIISLIVIILLLIYFIYLVLLDQIPELSFALMSRISAVEPSVNPSRHAFPKR